jgi:predicted GIY-YIG superfamily endonuclease
MPPADTSTSVYRCINAAGDTVYVGSTTDVLRRAGAHRRHSGWWTPGIRLVTICVAPLTEARRIERRLIAAVRPPNNQYLNPDRSVMARLLLEAS